MQAPDDGGTPGTRVRRFSNRNMGYGILDLAGVFPFISSNKGNRRRLPAGARLCYGSAVSRFTAKLNKYY